MEDIPNSQVLEPDSQVLCSSQDYPLTQQQNIEVDNQDEEEEEEDEDEDDVYKKLTEESPSHEPTMKRLDRGNHKCCIAALQYAMAYGSFDIQEVIKSIARIEKNHQYLKKRYNDHSTKHFYKEQNIPLEEVFAFLHWVKQKTA